MSQGGMVLLMLCLCLKGHKSLQMLCDGDADRMNICKSVTDQPSNGLTGVGSRDTCMSKNYCPDLRWSKLLLVFWTGTKLSIFERKSSSV